MLGVVLYVDDVLLDIDKKYPKEVTIGIFKDGTGLKFEHGSTYANQQLFSESC